MMWMMCPNKQSDSDPIPTWHLKECSSILVPTVTNIVNLSLTTGQFHPTIKEPIISPLLKKPTLDKEELSSYRPISNLSLISKIIERVVKSRLTDHLTSNSFLNSHQSAYCKHHSTETALLYIHDHLITHQCNRITENVMPLPTRPLCCFRQYWPWHLDHSSLILVWYPWLWFEPRLLGPCMGWVGSLFPANVMCWVGWVEWEVMLFFSLHFGLL